MKVRLVLLSVFGLIAAIGSAQVMIKPKGQNLTPLVQSKLEASVMIDGAFAESVVTMTFANPSQFRQEIEFVYSMPPNALATGFSYWYQGEEVAAKVVERERARQIYQAITSRQRDPALIELIGKRLFRAKIFPVEPNTPLVIRMKWVSVLHCENGFPTMQFPLATKEREPLEVDIKISAKPGVGFSGLDDNYGMKWVSVDDRLTSEIKGEKLRPDKNLRIRLIPTAKEGLTTSVYAARSGGSEGYFALIVGIPKLGIGPKPPSLSLSGIGEFGVSFDRKAVRAGSSVLVTGRYRKPGIATLRVGNLSNTVHFADRAEPNHRGLKLWAEREIERLGSLAKQVTAISVRHSIPSKYTSWLAIPAAERKAFEYEIKTSRLRAMGGQLSKMIAQNGVTRSSRRLQGELIKACKAMKVNALEFVPSLWEAVRQRAAIVAPKLRAIIKRGGDPAEMKRATASFDAFAHSLGVENPEQFFWQAHEEARQELIGDYLQSWSKSGEHSANTKRYWQQLGALKAANVGSWAIQNKGYELSNKLADLLTKGKVNTEESKRLLAQRRRLAQLGAVGPMLGGSAYTALRPHIELELKHKLGEFVNQNALLNARAMVQRVVDIEKTDQFVKDVRRGIAVTRTNQLKAEYQQAVRNGGYEGPTARGIARKHDLLRNENDGIDSLEQFMFRRASELGSSFAYSHSRSEFVGELPKMDENAKGLRPTDSEAAQKFDKAYRDGIASAISQLRGSAVYTLRYQKWKANPDEAEIARQTRQLDRYKDFDGLDWKPEYDKLVANQNPAEKTRTALLQRYREGKANDPETKRLERQFSDLGEAYKERIVKLRLNAEIDALERATLDEAQQEAIRKRREELNQIIARVGDPLLQVALQGGVVTAIATFPWGETRGLQRVNQTWQCRFDIPPGTAEGVQHVTIDFTLSNGAKAAVRTSFVVDLTPPVVQVSTTTSAGRLRIELDAMPNSVARAKLVAPWADPITFIRGGEGLWWTSVSVPSGASLEGAFIAVFDEAHNQSRWSLAGQRLDHPALNPIAEMKKPEDRTGNVQHLSIFNGRLLVSTLDEGLWDWTPQGASRVANLPSSAPRNSVVIGDQLYMRFGDGELISISPDGEVTRLHRMLPRKQALAIATDGTTLVVAQPGGYSEFDGITWTHHFRIPALIGRSPSALAANQESIWFAAQGAGVIEINRSTGKTRIHDERAGMPDDWITTLNLGTPTVAGTFIGGLAIWNGHWKTELAGHSGTALLRDGSGVLVGTRSGLFRLQNGLVSKISDVEVQALATHDGKVYVGTRWGIILLSGER